MTTHWIVEFLSTKAHETSRYHHLQRHRVCAGPFRCGADGIGFVTLPHFGGFVVQRIIGIGGGQESLNRQEDSSDLKSGTPFVFQNIQTYSAQAINIWMKDSRQKSHLWRRHWIVLRKEELKTEMPLGVWAFIRTRDHDTEKSCICVAWNSADSWDRFTLQSLSFLSRYAKGGRNAKRQAERQQKSCECQIEVKHSMGSDEHSAEMMHSKHVRENMRATSAARMNFVP